MNPTGTVYSAKGRKKKSRKLHLKSEENGVSNMEEFFCVIYAFKFKTEDMEPNMVKLKLILFVLFSAYAASALSSPALVCSDAEKGLCDDLLGYEVEVEYHANKRKIGRLCGRLDAKACAKIYPDRQLCVVHVSTRHTKAELTHELNHCNGWSHTHEKTKSYRSEWTPLNI